MRWWEVKYYGCAGENFGKYSEGLSLWCCYSVVLLKWALGGGEMRVVNTIVVVIGSSPFLDYFPSWPCALLFLVRIEKMATKLATFIYYFAHRWKW